MYLCRVFLEMMNKIRDYMLPIAIVLGLIFHEYCAIFKVIVPYLIFAILLLNFVAVDMKKLRFTMLDFWLMAFQITVSLGSYALLKVLHVSEIVAQGVLVGVICPVAASVVVISCILGANRETVTAYTIFGNLMVAVAVPIIFSFVGENQDLPFWQSFVMILRKIGSVIGLPFLIALCFYFACPKINSFLSRFKGATFYIWSVALFITLGQTIDFIFLHGEGNWSAIISLAIASLLYCVIQFGFGRWLGKQYGDKIAGGQLLGQKNTAIGIWIANTYLAPLASVYAAFYSIWQNVFNSWQLWRHDKDKR